MGDYVVITQGLGHRYAKDYVVVGFLSIRGLQYHHQKLVTLEANSHAGGLALLCRVYIDI